MKRPILATTALALAAVVAGLVMAGSSVAASSLPTLTLTLNGKSVAAGGQMVSGAVNIQTTVTGEAQGEPALIYLDPGVPYSVVPKLKAEIQAHNGDFNYLDGYGSMVFDAAANKGTSSEQTVLKPGNYLALDLNGKHATPGSVHGDRGCEPGDAADARGDDRVDRVQLHRRDDAARRRARPVRERRLPVPHDPGARRQERRRRQEGDGAAARAARTMPPGSSRSASRPSTAVSRAARCSRRSSTSRPATT